MNFTFLSFFLFTINSFCQKWEAYTTSNSGIPSNSVTGIAAAENGKIWISTLSGIASFDSQWHRYGINNSSCSFDEIKHIWCTDNLIWVGTDTRGLWSFDGLNQWTDYSAYSSGNGIEGFGIDPQDTIWVLDKFGNFSKWMDYYWVDVLDFIDHPNSLFIDANGNKWVMSGNMGLIRYSNGETFYFNDPWDENSPSYIPDASLFSHGPGQPRELLDRQR